MRVLAGYFIGSSYKYQSHGISTGLPWLWEFPWDPHTHGNGVGMGIRFSLWGYPYGDPHKNPVGMGWEWG